jgi:hypothetical protein
MHATDPFSDTGRRASTDGPFDPAELRLANRNSGILLEALRHDGCFATASTPYVERAALGW